MPAGSQSTPRRRPSGRSKSPQGRSKSPRRSKSRGRGGEDARGKGTDGQAVRNRRGSGGRKRSAEMEPSMQRRGSTSKDAAAAFIEGFWRRGVPCISYASSSVFMTLAQKYVVVNSPEVKSIFLFFQNAAALLMFIPSSLGWLSRFHVQPYSFWETSLALEVLPLGVTYTVMLYTSNVALSLLTVPMVSVLKNLGPIAITLVESYVDNVPLSLEVLASMAMLTLGSIVAGYNDLSFDLNGYLAMFFNVLTNIIHVSLTKRLQKRGLVRKEVSLHYQSIFMCIFLIVPLCTEDVSGIVQKLTQQSLSVQLAFLSTGANGIIIALCSMWCIEATSGSTYSMVGALNKIPSSILGMVIFHDKVNAWNLGGVSIGLIGGIIFTMAKIRMPKPGVRSPPTKTRV